MDTKPLNDPGKPCIKVSSNRSTWTNKKEYFLACLGFSVGYGNVWRFPYLCYQNGGGAFLVPYFIIATFVGLPMLFLELSIGQFMRRGPVECFNMVPAMKGIGMAMVVILVYCALSYIVILSWGLFYFVHSFTLDDLPWTTCENWWNTKDCMSFENYTEHGNNVSSFINQTTVTDNILPVEEFWSNYVIRKSRGLEEVGSVDNWRLLVCFFMSWLICYLSIFKGVKLTGKIVYFTALFPYVILIVLAVRGCTLEGAGDGIKFYLLPNFTRLSDSDVWLQAGSQVCYSYGIGCGVFIAFGSYNEFNVNCLRNAVGVAVCGSFTSLLAGLGVFSVLGHMASVAGKNVSDVVTSGPGLVFQTYPTALSVMPLPQVWSILFFFMIILLGIDSQFAFMESIICAVSDFFPELVSKKKRTWFILTLCLAFAVFGIPFTLGCGIYIFELFNTYSVSGFCFFALIIMESATFAYLYGMDKFFSDIKSMIGYQPSSYFKWCYKFLVPVICMVLLILSVKSYRPLTIQGYVYPSWGYALGWMMALSSVILVPTTFIYKISKSQGTILQRLKKITKPKYSDHLIKKRWDNNGTTRL